MLLAVITSFHYNEGRGIELDQTFDSMLNVLSTRPQKERNNLCIFMIIFIQLGIAILTIGTLTFLFGMIARSISNKPHNLPTRPNLSSSGIWSGVFIIVAGSLITSSGYYKNNKCLRIGALMMCIVAMVAACISGVISLVWFG